MLVAVQDALRAAAAAGRRTVTAGPFDLFVHPTVDRPSAGYAIPAAGARPTDEDAERLLDAFAAAGRTPRLEYLPALAPDVEAVLVRRGFVVEARLRLMACRPGEHRPLPAPAGTTLDDVDPATAPAAARDLLRTQLRGFGDAVDEEAVHRDGPIRVTVPAVLARVEGEPAGGGQCLPPQAGTAELVGIAVLPRFRRRGIAAAVTSRLLERAFGTGVELAVLTPGDDDTARIYARCGFVTCGEMLHLRHP